MKEKVKCNSVKISPEARQFFMELALKLSKKNERVFVKDIFEYAYRTIKSGKWNIEAVDIK